MCLSAEKRGKLSLLENQAYKRKERDKDLQVDLLSVGESVMLLCRLGGFPGEGLHPEKLMKSEGLLEPPLARRFRLGSRSGNEGAEWRERQAEECAQSQKPEGELNRNRAWSSRRKEEHPRKVLRSSSSPPIQAFIHSFIHPSTNTYSPQ